MTRQLAASARLAVIGAPAGRHAAAAAGLSARDIAGLIFLGLVLVLLYLGSCLVWPYGPCLKCAIEGTASARGGRGRSRGSTSRRHGRCRACKGTGERLRVGTRLIRGWTNGRLPK